MREELLYGKGDEALEEVAQRGCGVFFLCPTWKPTCVTYCRAPALAGIGLYLLRSPSKPCNSVTLLEDNISYNNQLVQRVLSGQLI